MIRTEIWNCMKTNGRWASDGGGLSDTLRVVEQETLDDALVRLQRNGCEIIDIKVTHFTTCRHNNGGYDEVWTQYTIIYKKG